MGVRSNGAYSGGARHECTNSSINPKIKFNFIGDKIYILSSTYSAYSSNIEIKIDNISESFSEAFSNADGFCVCYIKNNLNFKEHFVEITKLTAGSYSADFILDAIDINNNGELKLYSDRICLYLIKDEDNIYTTDGSTLNITSESEFTIDLFNQYGIDDLSLLNSTVISKVLNDKYNIALLV